jgi:hypothetical protein
LHDQRHREPKGLSGLLVDDQFKLNWRLHREFARTFALQDAIDVGC